MNKFIRWIKDLFFEKNLEEGMKDFEIRIQKAQENIDKLIKAVRSEYEKD